MDPSERRYTWRSCFVFVILSPLLTFFCAVSVYAAIHIHCQQEANIWVLDYPGATLVSEDYTWLGAYSIGETVRVLYTTDSASDVRRWYITEYRRLGDEGKLRNSGLARIDYRVFDADDREGSFIYLFCNCSDELVLW
jgi:hypothetical protein